MTQKKVLFNTVDVTYHTCYEPEAELIKQVKQFERRVALMPNPMTLLIDCGSQLISNLK